LSGLGRAGVEATQYPGTFVEEVAPAPVAPVVQIAQDVVAPHPVSATCPSSDRGISFSASFI